MRLLFLLLFSSLVFGQYADPPISDVMEENIFAAQALEGHYNSSTAHNSTVHVSLGGYSTDINVSASLDIVGPSILVDNMTSPLGGLSLIVARGYRQEHLQALPSEGYNDFFCDYDWFQGGAQYAWRCDFDHDNCVEFENRTFVVYDINATFTFRNISASTPLTSTLVSLPSGIIEAMKGASGSEELNVSLDGNVTFIYQINDRASGFGDCSSNYTNFSESIPFSLNSTYLVGGQHKLFFLRAPVLREQWFRNNRFDAIVLSQSPLYRTTVFLNGDQSRNFTLRNFTVVLDQYGVRHILSNKTNETGYFEGKSEGTSPIPLENENHTFAYTYEFNYSYANLGINNLSLAVEDNFRRSEQYNESILSRMLSYDGTTAETGLPADESLTRKSSGFKKDDISFLEISFGLIALVLLLAFLNFWLAE
jgi:hypothetical protein